MKFTTLLTFVFAPALVVFGQTQVNPDNTAQQVAATKRAASELPAASPSATAAIEPPSLIPPNILPAPSKLPKEPTSPDLQLLNALFKQTTLGKIADQQRLHVQGAALEVQIRDDPQLHALKADAFRAPTDLERRHRLRTYYKAYYDKLRGLTPSPDLKDYLSGQEAAHELALLQPRVRHQTDEAEANKLAKAQTGTAGVALPAPTQAPVNDILPHN